MLKILCCPGMVTQWVTCVCALFWYHFALCYYKVCLHIFYFQAVFLLLSARFPAVNSSATRWQFSSLGAETRVAKTKPVVGMEQQTITVSEMCPLYTPAYKATDKLINEEDRKWLPDLSNFKPLVNQLILQCSFQLNHPHHINSIILVVCYKFLKCKPHMICYLAALTFGQINNSLWLMYRKGRLMAGKFTMIIHVINRSEILHICRRNNILSLCLLHWVHNYIAYKICHLF